jgi:DNA-binding response OmpR family regulator
VAGERILVIEDDPKTLEFLLSTVLLPQGYLVQVGHSVQAALDVMEKGRPDLVLLDLSVYDVEWDEITPRLRSLGSPPVVVLTPPGAEANALQALHQGAIDALTSPLVAQDVTRKVAQVLHQERLARERDGLLRRLAAANATLEKSVTDLQALQNLGQEITSSLNLQNVLTLLVQAAISVTQAEASYVLLNTACDAGLYLRAFKNTQNAHASELCIQINDNVASHVIRTAEPIFLSSRHQVSLGAQLKAALGCAGGETQSLANVPLMNHRRPIGILGVVNPSLGKATPEVLLSNLNTLADFAAIAIQNSETFAQTDRKLSATLGEIGKYQQLADFVLNNISEGVCIVDQDLRLTSTNPAFERLTGWSASELQGRRFEEILLLEPDGGRPASDCVTAGVIQQIEHALHHNSAVAPTYGILVCRNENRVAVIVAAVPTKDSSARATGLLVTVQERAATEKGTLNTIAYPPSLRGKLTQLDQLLEQALDTLVLETSWAATQCHPITLRPIINQVVKRFREKAPHCLWETVIEPELPFANGNANKLEFALINLIESALLLTRTPVRISAQADGHLVVVAVESEAAGDDDKGRSAHFLPGIDDQDTAILRRDSASWWVLPQVKLLIAQRLIEAQGGQLWVEDWPGTATRFRFSLPKIEVHDVAEAFID